MTVTAMVIASVGVLVIVLIAVEAWEAFRPVKFNPFDLHRDEDQW